MKPLLAALFFCAAASLAAEPPPVMLANVHHAGDARDLSDYWVSEKLDGVRAYWTGTRLLTRGGHHIAAPDWFTRGWPTFPLDGELWAGRGQFEFTSGTVRQQLPDDAAWKRLRYMVFDLPQAPGAFTQRLAVLRSTLGELAIPWLQAVEQHRFSSHAELDARLQSVIEAGGEGLMLHRGSSLYSAARSDDLLKYKRHDDAEAVVIAHLPGQGKYEGLMGALLVRRPDGLEFRIGTGFTDAQRRHPPPVGSTITYAYNGLTPAGVPRFPRFVRLRPEGS